jgi:hypothetical protein
MRIKIIVSSLLLFGCPQIGFCTLVAEKKAMTSIIKQIQQDEGLSVINMSRIDQSTGKCSLSFKSSKDLTLPQARKLLVEVMEKFRQKFNERWDLYSRVDGGTIDTKNIELTIEFENAKANESISRIVHKDGKLYFSFHNEKVVEEDYGNALLTVHGLPVDLARKLISNKRR